MKKTFQVVLVGLLTSAFSLTAQAPYAQEERLFYEGKEFFSAGNYVGATEKMIQYKQVGVNADLKQEADYYIGAAAYEQNRASADELLASYLEKYPSGRHTLGVKFMKGNRSFFNKQYPEAIELYKAIDSDQLSSYDQEDYFLRLAISLLKEKRMKEAEQLFVAVNEVSLRHKTAARYYLGYIAYTEGDYKRALPMFEEVKNSKEFSATAPYYIAQIKYSQRRYEEVIALGEPLSKVRSTEVTADMRSELDRILGESYYYTGDRTRAIRLLTDYVKVERSPLRTARYLLGISLFENGEYAKALNEFGQVTAVNDAMSQSAYLYMGQSQLNLGDKKGARMSFELAMKSGNDKEIRETAMYNYAMLVHDTSYSLFDESVTIFEQFINEFPNSRYADKINDYLVEVYMTTKNYGAALTSISKIRQPSQKVLRAKQRILFQLGTQAVANSDFKGAIMQFNEVMKLGDLDRETKAEAYFWRGESLYRSTLYMQAAKDFHSFVTTTTQKDKPIYNLALYNLGYSYFKQQDFNNAMRWFNSYISADNGKTPNMYADALNRLGDCYFDRRDFANAERYYERAAETQPSAADYAMYQRGFVLGLQKDYKGKIEVLNRLIREMPQSSYVDDAMYEKGRTFVMMEQNGNAEQTYKELLSRFPKSEMARKASVQLALLYFNTNQLDKAMSAYKQVVSDYPGSEEATTALQDLKTVYLEKDDVQGYAAYLRTVNTNVKFEVTEQDSLTYLSAERIYARGDAAAAERAFGNYLQSYPEGAFMVNANYYLGSIFFARKDYARASSAFERVLSIPQNKFAEDALARSSEIAYLENNFEKALNYFKQLEAMASKPENIRAAKLGVLRCAEQLGKADDALAGASALLQESNLSPEIKQEAQYIRGKMLVQSNKAGSAISDLTEAAKDTRTRYGAESNYLLAKAYDAENQSKRAEEVILAFMDKGTPHQYWMARSFLLLADVYVKQGRKAEARQYLDVLRSNYKANDEIASEITKRLNSINN